MSNNLSPTQLREIYNDISSQVEREDELINNRTTWVLQINGFLFAALALLNSNEPVLCDFLRYTLPIVGLLVSISGLLGVSGALRQLRYLTNLWQDKVASQGWPRPFGADRAFLLGALPALIPPITLTVVWVTLLFFL